MASDDQDRDVIEVYVAYLNDVNQLRTSRQTDNTTRLGVVTLLLGAQAFLINMVLSDVRQTKPTFLTNGLASWVPIVGIAVVGFIGCYFCLNWRRLLEDTQKTLNFKFGNLENLEREHHVLQQAGAQLFLKERADRHRERATSATTRDAAKRAAQLQPNPSRIVPVAVADAAPMTTPLASAPSSKPRRGVSRRVTDLARFFFWLFLINSVGAPVAKILAVWGPSWLASIGIGIR